MKAIPQLQLPRALRPRATFLVVLAGCLAAGLAATHAAPPSLQPLFQGKWLAWPRGGSANDVKVVGNYAYLALRLGGLVVVDMSSPTNCVSVGGYDTSGSARGVAVSGNYAYVADGPAGVQVIDVSNPTNCVRVGDYAACIFAHDVAVSGNYAYVADVEDYGSGLQVIDVSNPTNGVYVGGYGSDGAIAVTLSGNYACTADVNQGLLVFDVRNPASCVRVGGIDHRWNAYGVLPTLPNVQFTVRVDATPNVPFTIEAATHLNSAIPWMALLTTNVPVMPFDFVAST